MTQVGDKVFIYIIMCMTFIVLWILGFNMWFEIMHVIYKMLWHANDVGSPKRWAHLSLCPSLHHIKTLVCFIKNLTFIVGGRGVT